MMQTIFCDKCERVAFIGWSSPDGPSIWYSCRDHMPESLRAVTWWHTNREPENRLHWVLTDASYAARGAVCIEGGRFIGYDTSGAVVFNRKDYNGALAAIEKKGLRAVARGYYGVASPYEMNGESAAIRAHRLMDKESA